MFPVGDHPPTCAAAGNTSAAINNKTDAHRAPDSERFIHPPMFTDIPLCSFQSVLIRLRRMSLEANFDHLIVESLFGLCMCDVLSFTRSTPRRAITRRRQDNKAVRR